MPTKADQILAGVVSGLGLDPTDPLAIYANINEIVEQLALLNAAETISVSTTGTITERLCEYGLKVAAPDSYRKLAPAWKWLGDFYVQGAPFNTLISVKSFKAKERLLSSGTGNLLSPTLGYGLFNDPKEWSQKRVASYVFRAFFGIYMPYKLLTTLSVEAKEQKNINGMPFLRCIEDFISDIRGAMNGNLLDPRKL
ncbi:MAG: hypothetical protein M3Q55_13600 [Acidobacteriota bacterium]|nr:hypothetical protein [Acidobacteriota bacterium]